MERSNGGYSILTDSHLWQVLDTNALESWTEAQPRFSSHVAHTVLKQLLFICAVLPRWKQCIYTPGCHSSKLREQQRERCFLTPQCRKLATLLLEYFSSSFPFFPMAHAARTAAQCDCRCEGGEVVAVELAVELDFYFFFGRGVVHTRQSRHATKQTNILSLNRWTHVQYMYM